MKGFRLGKDAKGRVYQQVSVPGTGIYRRDYASSSPNLARIVSQKYVVIAIVIGLVVLWAILR
jgi:hypothetical protein